MKIKIVGINARFTHSCLALFYLRNELEKNIDGCRTEICQYTINDPYYTIIQRLSTGKPDYIFFSAVIWNSEIVEQLVTDMLIVDNDCRFVIGGPQARIVGEKFSTSDRVSIFFGEIEAAEARFFDEIKNGTPSRYYEASFLKSGIKHLAYPYRTSDFAEELKNRHIYYETSRGCPFNCSYCLSSAEQGIFHKELKQVFKELDDILSFKPSVVRFLDRTFNDNKDRALQIWQYLNKYEGETLFHFEIAPEQFDDKMLRFLTRIQPGRFQFEIGIQSTNRETLAAIRRPMDPCNAGKIVRKLRRMENIHLHADLILGLPYETIDSFSRSFKDVFSMEPHYIQMGLLKLLPDTAIKQQAKTFGYRAATAPPYSVFANGWMSSAELGKLYWFSECVEKCVNNRYFISLWRYFQTISEDMAAFFISLSELFFGRGYFWKAATQETLSCLLVEHTKDRNDSAVLKELLCYDWLRCGHRFLPDHLLCGRIGIDELRRKLFCAMADGQLACFAGSTRKQFFKKGVFQIFSRETLVYLGYVVTAPEAVVRFAPERENNVNRLNRAAVIEGITVSTEIKQS